MIDRLDLLLIKSIIETQTIGGQTFSSGNTEFMPYTFKCSNSSWIITAVMSHVIKLKVWSIDATDIVFVGDMEVDEPTTVSDFVSRLGGIINPS